MSGASGSLSSLSGASGYLSSLSGASGSLSSLSGASGSLDSLFGASGPLDSLSSPYENPSGASIAYQLANEHPGLKEMVRNNEVLGMMLNIFISRNIPKSDIYDSLVILKDYKDIQNLPPDDVQAKLPASVRALLKDLADAKAQESYGGPDMSGSDSATSLLSKPRFPFGMGRRSPFGMGRSKSDMGGDVSMIINNAISPMQNGIIAIQSSLLNIEGNVQTILSQIAAASAAPATAQQSSDENSNNNANSGGGRRRTKRSKQKRKTSKKSYRRH